MDTLGTELRILASLLAAPDQGAKEAVEELAVHYQWLQPAARELKQLSLDQWQAEYARLFISDDSAMRCSAYESVYLHGCRHGPPERSLRDLYRRIGMGSTGAPVDYIGTLLECAAHIQADPRLGKDFWEELWDGHLRNWVPNFCRELHTASRLVLYRIVGRRLCELFPEVRQAMSAVA